MKMSGKNKHLSVILWITQIIHQLCKRMWNIENKRKTICGIRKESFSFGIGTNIVVGGSQPPRVCLNELEKGLFSTVRPSGLLHTGSK